MLHAQPLAQIEHHIARTLAASNQHKSSGWLHLHGWQPSGADYRTGRNCGCDQRGGVVPWNGVHGGVDDALSDEQCGPATIDGMAQHRWTYTRASLQCCMLPKAGDLLT